ncbi:hypothetical protein [Nocardia sp. NPDC051832]|uniref:hypothetical protein n=1 Tax=Nocardia sp. NPDC051832 TaxID=3155673 RepID=UPI0034497E7E
MILSTAIGSAVPVHAAEPATLAETTIAGSEVGCIQGAPTFDNVVTSAATAIRSVVPVSQRTEYDRAVNDFRHDIATVRVDRGLLPVHPSTVNERTDLLDDPIVTYLVNGLDAVRAGRIGTTVSVTELTVNDAIEVFVLATGIVRIPAHFAAGAVPMVGFFLKPVVNALANGVKTVARTVQDHLANKCLPPETYPDLDLGEPVIETVPLPKALIDLANSVVRADGMCTPIADLTIRSVVEKTRDFLHSSQLPLDRAAMHAAAESTLAFLDDHYIAKVLLMRRTEELGMIVDSADFGPLTFLANLGFDIYESRALDTVRLADIEVENVFDLVTLTIDVASLLTSAGTTVAGLATAGVAGFPLALAHALAFAPATYGAPILRGVMQSMCTA